MNNTHRPRPIRADRRRRALIRVAAVGAAGILALAACGDDDDTSTDTEAPAETPGESAAPATTTGDAATTAPASDAPATTGGDAATTAPAAEAGVTVASAETSLGAVLVDANGLTLYAFIPDGAANGEPTCVDDCAGAWPPALVDGDPVLGEGLDAAVFTVVEHPTGSMLKAGDWPLYTFAGDSAPGDVNGQGSGDVWFAVAPDGTPID